MDTDPFEMKVLLSDSAIMLMDVLRITSSPFHVDKFSRDKNYSCGFLSLEAIRPGAELN